MACSAHRVVMLLLFIGFLTVQPEKVSGLSSVDLALRWNKVQTSFIQHFQIRKAVAVEDMNLKPDISPAPSMTFDPNQSNKRRVRRGSDPIHNRC